MLKNTRLPSLGFLYLSQSFPYMESLFGKNLLSVAHANLRLYDYVQTGNPVENPPYNNWSVNQPNVLSSALLAKVVISAYRKSCHRLFLQKLSSALLVKAVISASCKVVISSRWGLSWALLTKLSSALLVKAVMSASCKSCHQLFLQSCHLLMVKVVLTVSRKSCHQLFLQKLSWAHGEGVISASLLALVQRPVFTTKV